MKKTVLLVLIFMVILLPSCNLPEEVTEDMMRTIVASTLQAKINMIGSMTPPTPTPTNTEVPTETPTPTITPTPTLEPTATWVMHERGSANVLVLYYHDIVKDRNDDKYYQWEIDDWYVKPLEFEQQMRMLHELNYTTITISQLVKVLYEGGELPERPVLVTFDSTRLGQWKNAYPTMKKYGQVGNLMIQAYHVDAKNSLSSDQIKTMMADGWEIGSSGYYGAWNDSRTTYGQEVGMSKVKLEELFEGVQIQAFSYPDGYTDPAGEIIRRVGNAYRIAFSRQRGTGNEISINQSLFIPRVEVTGGLNYQQFLDLLPWKEGSLSRETMEWTIPTPTLEPEFLEMTRSAAETEMALDE